MSTPHLLNLGGLVLCEGEGGSGGGGGGGGGGGHIGFSADTGRRVSLYPPNFLNQGGNFTKVAWIYHWDKPKS